MVYLRTYRTRAGKRRVIRLYEAWRNMNGRCAGRKSRSAGKYWKVQVEFDSWEHFRSWSLANGYGKGRELDRKLSHKNYSPENCQWLTRAEHWAKTRGARSRGNTVTPKPDLPDPDVPF